jgi:hypothetical protein
MLVTTGELAGACRALANLTVMPLPGNCNAMAVCLGGSTYTASCPRQAALLAWPACPRMHARWHTCRRPNREQSSTGGPHCSHWLPLCCL